MKTPLKTLACAAMASLAFLACEDTGINNPNNSTKEGNLNVPAMNSNVVSYRSPLAIDEYTMQQLGEEWYRHGFVTDKEILKIWFPHIFNGEQSESECNYFALHFIGSSSGLANSYEILAQDMTLSRIACTWKGTGITTADFAKRAMLICDNKDWNLKESIDLDAINFHNDPNWKCESGAGSPNWEKIYF
jgi:hypothetical protein